MINYSIVYIDDVVECFEYADGYKSWWIRNTNIRHRIDGPAIESNDDYKCWFINGEKYTEEEFNIIIQCPWMIG